MGDMDEMVKDFLVESHENLDRLDREFVALEKDPSNREHMASIFRAIHTIKGTSGFFGFEKLEKVTHGGENLLSKLRDGKLSLTVDMASTLLQMVDAVRAILAHIEQDNTEGDNGFISLIARLEELQSGSAAPVHIEEPTTETITAATAQQVIDTSPESFPTEKSTENINNPLTREIRATEHGPTDVKVDLEAQTRAELNDAHGVADTTIRVDVKLLDQLMTLVGELVLVRNRIMQTQVVGGPEAQATTQRLNTLTSELQEGVMKTRMQPIGNVWSKFPRVVRDLSKLCAKQVKIAMEGAETELDKSLIEAIKDPLTHIIRNSIDHGIETPAVRAAARKPPEGTLTLRAYHESGLVNIEIIDDGGGINVERVKAKAIEKGIITKEHASKLTERDLVSLIFAPGFSTAEKITNISGRGVGMDVVKTNIERIGGTVDIQTKLGVGTTLRIKIPLTLAIVPALIVASGGERFAIPQVSLLELVRLDSEQAKQGIETIYGAQVYRLRGQLLPLIRLNRELGIPLPSEEPEAINLVVLQADERVFGLIVDTVCDSEEIVVKPLSKLLKSLNVFAGATIMGDGQVALILDVMGLGQRAHVVTENKERNQVMGGKAGLHKQNGDDARQVQLVFQSPDDGRMAIPISRISRLEELAASSIERAGNHEVTQYRGSILPLIRVFQVLPERRVEPRNPEAGVVGDMLPVVVITHGERRVGLVIGRIVDTVETSIHPTRAASRAGILGCQVISEKVTEMLDIEFVVRSVIPDFYTSLETVDA